MEVIESSHISNFTTIYCCLCGISFNPGISKSNICLNCISNQNDISMGITKQGILNFCRNCRRYNRPPWVNCDRESKELLSICLKKIKGLNRVKLIDACFIWTEPHSRRIKVKITIQKDVLNNTSVQQSFVVEFEEYYQQCDDCKKEYTPHTWNGLVQVRQKASHKKTFFYIEQIILKNNAHDKCLKIKEEDEGIDFFFKNKTHALRLLDFLQTIIMTKVKQSKQLVSQDYNSNTFNYKYVFSVEIPKICKYDLVIIPKKLKTAFGGVSTALICQKVTNAVHLVDCVSGKTIEINDQQYFQFENDLILVPLRQFASQFMVLSIEKEGKDKKSINSTIGGYKYQISRLEVARMSDWKTFSVRSHLGDFLHEGNTVLAYDLTAINISEGEIDITDLPELLIVKRDIAKKNEKRIWKVRRMDIEEKDENNIHKKDNKKKEEHFEEFLEEIEEDVEMRQNINLYKDNVKIKSKKENIQPNKEKKKDNNPKQKEKEKRKILKVKVDESKRKEVEEKEKEKEKQKEKEKPKKVDDSYETEEEDENGIKLEDLLDDLKLDDDPITIKENEEMVDDFIKKMENIKISKD